MKELAISSVLVLSSYFDEVMSDTSITYLTQHQYQSEKVVPSNAFVFTIKQQSINQKNLHPHQPYGVQRNG